MYQRRILPAEVVSLQVGREVVELSTETGRRTGILINRKGTVELVAVGDPGSLMLPNLEHFRYGRSRLKGLRFIHSLRCGESLSSDDYNDLALLRLDFIAGIEADETGEAMRFHGIHLLPRPRNGSSIEAIGPISFGRSVHEIDFSVLIRSLEEEFSQIRPLLEVGDAHERALLVSVGSMPRPLLQERMVELAELAGSSGMEVVGSVIQSRKKQDQRTLLGKGKLGEIVILALQSGAEVLLFDQDLNPSQVKGLTNATELKIVDRTQVILDIFAQRAKSREGKIQVELAQLNYMLPRLVTKNTAMSRLTGGIGGRGPGETKLEINRRRARERILRLQGDLNRIRTQRKSQLKRRRRRDLPVVAIIGYTNAGKSTLLNTLTKSDTFVQNRLFATLDPASRRLRFPKDREIIITDTVGFIHDLPKDLMEAFQATLEQLEDAHLLLHVVDISNARFEHHIQVVNTVLDKLKLSDIPQLMIFNKEDLTEASMVAQECVRHHALSITAVEERTLPPLVREIERRLWPESASSVVHPSFERSAGTGIHQDAGVSQGSE